MVASLQKQNHVGGRVGGGGEYDKVHVFFFSFCCSDAL